MNKNDPQRANCNAEEEKDEQPSLESEILLKNARKKQKIM